MTTKAKTGRHEKQKLGIKVRELGDTAKIQRMPSLSWIGRMKVDRKRGL